MYEIQYNLNPQSIKFASPIKNMLKYFQTKRLSILTILAFYTSILYLSWIKFSFRDTVGKYIKLQSAFGYSPKVALSKGVSRLIEWYTFNYENIDC